MTKQPRSNLPEPGHPFARWGAGAAISCWALIVQDFSSPLNKLGAIVSPGVGYIFGLALDSIIFHVSEANSKRKKRRHLLETKKRMDDLYKERQNYIQDGASLEIIESVDCAIETCRRIVIATIAPGESKKW
jgi:hypothetical protein